MSCPANSNYSSCMSACPASCNDLTSPSECESPCVEGCECLPGYVLSGSDCVPYKQCGCTYLNKYYEVQSLCGSDSSCSIKKYFLLLLILRISSFSPARNFVLETKSNCLIKFWCLEEGNREQITWSASETLPARTLKAGTWRKYVITL